MRNLANQAGKGQYKSKSHSMEFNFNQAAVSKDGLEVHSKMSAFGPDNKKSADNLKSRVLGSNAKNENAYFSMSIGIRDGITDDNDLCSKFNKVFAEENPFGEDATLNFKFNNGRLFIRGAMTNDMSSMSEMLDIAKVFGKQTTPETIEAGFKLGFSLEDFFSPTAKSIPEFLCQGFTKKTTINLWDGFYSTIIDAFQNALNGKEDMNTKMMVQMGAMILPFYATETQGKVDIDLDTEDVASLLKLPMAQMASVNADTMLNTMTPFGSNDDAEMILDTEGIWCEFPKHTEWKKNTRDCAVEAFLDTCSEFIDCMTKGESRPDRVRGEKFKLVMMHALTMMIGNEMEVEIGGEFGEIPFYGKKMVRGPGQDKLMKAMFVMMAAKNM